MLLEGASGCGKTALASFLALRSGFPYVKIISPESLVKYLEGGKYSSISTTFENAYKSPYSVIILDNIENPFMFFYDLGNVKLDSFRLIDTFKMLDNFVKDNLNINYDKYLMNHYLQYQSSDKGILNIFYQVLSLKNNHLL